MTSGGLAAVTSSFFAALYSAFGKYDVVHIHAEGPAFFSWLPKMFGKRVVVTVHGIDWQREKWQSGLGSKFIHQGEKNAVKYADEVIVLSKGLQDYFKEIYGRKTHFIPNGVNRPQTREANLITDRLFLFVWFDVQFCATVLLTFEQSGCSFWAISIAHFCAVRGTPRNIWFGLEKPLDRRSISRAASSSRRARVTLEMLL